VQSPKSAAKSQNLQLPNLKLDVTVKFSPEQIHDLFERFDATNRNGLYALLIDYGLTAD
jgi:hypothetical protein